MEINFIIRILVGGILGGFIGLEREYRAKEAGFRTHFLVAIGSAMFMIVSQYGFDAVLCHTSQVSLDPSRIASQVVTGIGFIGAGTIIFQKHVIRGLTTAAGVWVTSAIGLSAGAGLYTLAVTCTLLVIICLEALNYTIQRFGSRNISFSFIAPDKQQAENVLQKLKNEGAIIHSYQAHYNYNATSERGFSYHVSIEMSIKRNRFDNNIVNFISQFNNVTIESIV